MPDPTRDHVRATAEHVPPSTISDGRADSDVVAPPPAGTGPAGYEMLGEIGRGGMGSVYRARDVRMNRLVAVKLLQEKYGPTSPAARRFLDEAAITGQLQHPGIPPVHQLGELPDGRPFLAMKLIQGRTLADILEDGSASRGSLIAVFEQICQAVGYAHANGVIHRDLKPANVMVGAFGEVQVMDWGLAKVRPTPGKGTESSTLSGSLPAVPDPDQTTDHLPGSGSNTREGSVLGTPAYMAPEQARGEVELVDARSDVFGLGAILCVVLTGRPPFAGVGSRSPLQAAAAGRLGDAFARLDTCGAEPELVALCKRCLSADRDARPRDAGEVAKAVADFRAEAERRARQAELDRVRVEGERARAEAEERERRKRRRVQFVLAGSVLVLIALAGVGVALTRLWRAAETARDQLAGEKRLTEDARDEAVRLRGVADAGRAEEEHLRGIADQALAGEAVAKKEVERQREEIARFHYGQAIRAVYQLWKDSRLAEARSRLAETRPDLRGWEYDYALRLCNSDLVTLRGHLDRITSAAWSPDGKKILTSAINDDSRVWDAATGTTLLALKGRPDRYYVSSWSPDGSKVLARSWGATAWVLDSRTGETVTELKGHASGLTASYWSPDGSKILTASNDRTARVWDAAAGKVLAELKGHADAILSAAWSPDGSKVITACNDRTVRVWDSSTGKVLSERPRHSAPVQVGSWSPDGSKVVTISDYKTAYVWDAATGKTLVELKGDGGGVSFVSWSPDGAHVFSNSSRMIVRGASILTESGGVGRIWDPVTGKLLHELVGHAAGVNFAVWAPDGSRILTCGWDRTARVWDTRSGTPLAELKGHSGTFDLASWSPDGSKILSASTDATARVWDPTTGEPVTAITGGVAVVTGASWSPDGTAFLTTRTDGTARVLDCDGKQLAVLRGHTATVNTAAWSPDGKKALTASEDGTARVWDPVAKTTLVELKGHTRSVYTASWSPDGSKVATASGDNTARIWDAATGAVLAEFKVEDSPYQAAATFHSATWSPDGTKLLTTNWDVARIWDVSTRKQLTELRGGRRYSPDAPLNDRGGNPFHFAVWSPDGSKVLSASHDWKTYLWDATSGRVLVEFKGHTAAVYSASYSADGKRVISVGDDSTVRIWDPGSGAELLALPGVSFASFSPDNSRVVTLGLDRGTILVYDCRAVNREFSRFPQAPAPRPRGGGGEN